MPVSYGGVLDSSFPDDLFTNDLHKSALTPNPYVRRCEWKSGRF